MSLMLVVKLYLRTVLSVINSYYMLHKKSCQPTALLVSRPKKDETENIVVPMTLLATILFGFRQSRSLSL